MIFTDETFCVSRYSRTITLDGPIIKTDKMKKKQHKFKVDTIKLHWYDDEQPAIAHTFGECVGKNKARDSRGYKLNGKEPKWLKDAING